MRLQDKHWNATTNKEIFGTDLHRFMEVEDHYNHMEIAVELGVSLGEVKMLKKKMTRA